MSLARWPPGSAGFRMRWRHLRPEELDHEKIWLAVSVTAIFVAWAVFKADLPLPKCLWHQFTGLPCPSCGGTRCARSILHGSWQTAFAMNPLVFLSIVGAILYDLYAAVVLLFRLPRLRFDDPPPWLSFWSRLSVAILFVANWTWLIAARR